MTTYISPELNALVGERAKKPTFDDVVEATGATHFVVIATPKAGAENLPWLELALNGQRYMCPWNSEAIMPISYVCIAIHAGDDFCDIRILRTATPEEFNRVVEEGNRALNAALRRYRRRQALLRILLPWRWFSRGE